MVSDSRKVAEDLQRWAQNMGFIPGSKFMSSEDYPSVDAFQKICKGKTVVMWKDIMRQVRPKDEILHIQKNLLLQRLKSGKSLEKNMIPGTICQQLILSKRIAAKQQEQRELLESIEKKELSIKIKEKSLRKSGHKILEVENQIDELKKKRLLFKIKTEECRSKLDYFKQISNVANGLCPPPPNAKPNVTMTSLTPEADLYKCIDAIKNFHSKTKQDDLDATETNESETDHLKDLWEYMKSSTNGWGAQHLWETMSSNFMVKLLEEISTLCGDETKAVRSGHDHALHVRDSISTLSAKLMVSTLECMSLQAKARIKQAELKKMKEELIKGFEDSKWDLTQMSKTLASAPDITKIWLDLQLEKAEQAGKLQGIKAELVRLKEPTSDYATVSSNLKLVKEDLARLDFQVNQDKRQLEENLAYLKQVPCRLESARTKALAQKNNFNNQLPLFLQSSKLKRVGTDSDSFSPPRAARFTSTMIENQTTDSNLSFNSTFGSIPEKFGGQSNLADVLLQLKESVSKEAKLFIKVHLDTIPHVHLNGKRESICNLMVHAPLMSSHSSNLPHRNFMQIVQGTPFSSTPEILLNQLHTLCHFKALQLYKIMHQLPCFSPLQAPLNLETLKKLTSKQEAALFEKVEVTSVLADKVDTLLSKCKTNLISWVEQPIQEAIPNDMVVNGRTFSDWCKLYDKSSNGN